MNCQGSFAASVTSWVHYASLCAFVLPSANGAPDLAIHIALRMKSYIRLRQSTTGSRRRFLQEDTFDTSPLSQHEQRSARQASKLAKAKKNRANQSGGD